MSTRVGDEMWAMNKWQAAAIGDLMAEYPPPMVVGWRAASAVSPAVTGHVFRTVEDDEAGRHCGAFSVYADGTIQWWTTKP